MSEFEHQILVPGGGHGAAGFVEAVMLTDEPNLNITALAPTFDNGGHTKRRRLDSEGMEIAYADAWKILWALQDPTQLDDPRLRATKNLLFSRNKQTGEAPGYGIVNNYFSKEIGFDNLYAELEEAGFRFIGKVLPASVESSHIRFYTENSPKVGFLGEEKLDEFADAHSTDRVIRMVLEPNVPAYPSAMDAVKNASIIFLPYGSPHGSILASFLPEGMKESLAQSKADVYLTTSLSSISNETNEFSPMDYIRLYSQYLGEGRIKGLIVPDMSRAQFEAKHPSVAALYRDENKHIVAWEDTELYNVQAAGIEVVAHQATKVVQVPGDGVIVRHDPEELAKVLKQLIAITAHPEPIR